MDLEKFREILKSDIIEQSHRYIESELSFNSMREAQLEDMEYIEDREDYSNVVSDMDCELDTAKRIRNINKNDLDMLFFAFEHPENYNFCIISEFELKNDPIFTLTKFGKVYSKGNAT